MIDFWGKKLGHVNRAVKILADTSLFSFLKKKLGQSKFKRKMSIGKIPRFFFNWKRIIFGLYLNWEELHF